MLMFGNGIYCMESYAVVPRRGLVSWVRNLKGCGAHISLWEGDKIVVNYPVRRRHQMVVRDGKRPTHIQILEERFCRLFLQIPESPALVDDRVKQ